MFICDKNKRDILSKIAVAPFAGAWIEIQNGTGISDHPVASLPSRERGLKYRIHRARRPQYLVAPFAGAWIEMCPN